MKRDLEKDQLNGRIGGIKKLAMDMAAKRKMMEKPGEQKESKDKDEKAEDIVDIARSIAGTRIEELKKSSSRALEDEEQTASALDAPDPEREGEIQGIMEDFIEIDTSSLKKDPKHTAEEVKDKLERFFEMFPPMNQLTESRTHYDNGNRLLKKGEEEEAIKEYRLSLSQAIRIGKVHSDLGKALNTVQKTLVKGVGGDDIRSLYEQAQELYGEGDLMGCARTISNIKDMMAAMNRKK
ncbi:MAG: hypothetical protein ACMUHB_01825 [Thermoplasmatota archaeon]